MRLAVIADVHANAPALDAVLAAVAAEKADRVVCLGDLVGYHADPERVVAHVRGSCDVVVAGNHDRDVTAGAPVPGTGGLAQAVQEWTRARLAPEDVSYLAGLPSHVIDASGFVAAHGAYLSDVFVNGYVTSTMLEKNLLALSRRDGWPRVALCGHTHVPMCGWLGADGSTVEAPFRDEATWPASAKSVLVNPGSVGQPRDGDPRAAFAIVDLARRTATVRRVAYDVERTVARLAAEGLPAVLGERLREGR